MSHHSITGKSLLEESEQYLEKKKICKSREHLKTPVGTWIDSSVFISLAKKGILQHALG